MKKEFLNLLNGSTELLEDITKDGGVETGRLQYNGREIKIVHGVPVFFESDINDEEQEKTNKTFSAKWNVFMRENSQSTYDYSMNFVLKRLVPLGIRTEEEFKKFLSEKEMIMDAGSGMGWMSEYMAQNTDGTVISVEIGDGVFAAHEKCKKYSNCHVIKADLMNLPFADNSFDYIHSDGVLHHTPNTKLAMKALYDKVRPGGVFWFYIYKEMNPVKHFCDDYIRQQFTKLSPEEALEQCRAITELGRALSKIDATITLERPIDVLNIPSGTFDLQRFVYYNFIKCFWNEQIGYDVSNIVNFDWYHPNNAQQQTEEEVRGWMKEYGIEDYDIYVANPNGMNVVIRKK